VSAEATDWLNVAVSIVALLIALATAFFAHRINRRATDIAQVQADLAHRAWADEFFRDVSQWATGVTQVIAKAIHFIEDAEVALADRREVLVSLSAAIDAGRWYFPNRYTEKYGTGKPGAYRGVRREVLDWIVEAYEIVSKPEGRYDARAELVNCQREFVSCVQAFLDPQSRERVMQSVLSSFVEASLLRQDKEPKQ
jgi:hypothetical protein